MLLCKCPLNKIRLVLAYSVHPKQSREVHGYWKWRWLDLAITDNELENVGRGLVIIAGWKRVGLGLMTSTRGDTRSLWINSKPPETSLRRPGIEPRSTAWKAAMHATTPSTLLYDRIDKKAGRDFLLLLHTQTCTHRRRGEDFKNCVSKAVSLASMV